PVRPPTNSKVSSRMHKDPPNDSDQCPPVLTAADMVRAGNVTAKPTPTPPKETTTQRAARERREELARLYKRPSWFHEIGSFADNFPQAFRALTRVGRSKRVRWPVKGDPYNNTLTRVLKVCAESDDHAPTELVLHFMNDALASDFSPTW